MTAATSSCASRSSRCTAGYGEGPWYLGATFGAASLDYDDIHRNIDLGAVGAKRERADARLRVHRPRAWRLLVQVPGSAARTVRARDLHEGDRPAVLRDRFGQHRAYVRPAGQRPAAVETRLAGRGKDRHRPAVGARDMGVRLARQRSHGDGASSNTLGGQLHVPAPKPDNSYALFNVGAAADFGGVTGYISGSGTAARGDGNYWAVTVGLRMPL